MAQAEFREFLIESEFKGDISAPWMASNKNRNFVRVTNTETDEYIEFDFWGSIVNPKLESDYDLLNAFYCIVNDAVSTDLGFGEFCSEFGYDEFSKEAKKVYGDCLDHLEMLERIYDGDIYDLVNDLAIYA